MSQPSAACTIDFPDEAGRRVQHRFANPRTVLTAWQPGEVAALLRQVGEFSRAGLWAVGMVSYEAATAFDPTYPTFAPIPGLPLAAFAIFDTPIENDPQNAPGDFSCAGWRNEITRTRFVDAIRTIREDIAAGDYYQTNFTTRFHSPFAGDAAGLFAALRATQPEAFQIYLDFDAWQIASVSPELFFRWDATTGALVTRPMKGTSPLSVPAAELAASVKDRAENLMIVDLLRNDISRIAKLGSVQVPHLFTIENLPTLRQMTSTVVGVTQEHVGLAEIFAALFPCGSITGAPKHAAMKAIAALEASPRGPYCGAMGIVQPSGAAIFSVGIRTVYVAKDKAECGIGAGITWGSDPQGEYAECLLKRRFLFRASADFKLLETIRLEGGKYWFLLAHLERLMRSADHFGFLVDRTQVERDLDRMALDHATGAHCVRLLLARDGRVQLQLLPLPQTPAAPTVVLASHPVQADDEFLYHKTTRRDVYEARAPKDTAHFDALLFNEAEEITEFTRGNVAVMIDGALVTPPLSSGLLPGTLRGELLQTGQMQERVVRLEDLKSADSIWFLNGLRGKIEVRLVHGLAG
ncbi:MULTISPECIES: chorismate-binding protein [unclassified Beijerinckia]|uniref:chorismate-binding protein n=1 Tax=unclassified Beijerinckia TaxID=2638183 RepID=UPI0008989F6C|nr:MULTISPECIES: chorismate-binding protein [unclassified Beijerinckia]MDH7798162.1 para-aminobenzoate synthetase/4-amino-4-deoxychorismate lyase [Beijerinckia sp. GAS462]SED11240.1 para-aminobenzoate synthetase / 4-amino-4-deoxychorismate lyase [Beijerinckia sp. 28-YEA-48]